MMIRVYTIAAFGIAIASGIASLALTNTTVVQGFEFDKGRQELAALDGRLGELNAEYIQVSTGMIEAQARSLGFETIERPLYIDAREAVAAR